jgi:hypothetical protein
MKTFGRALLTAFVIAAVGFIAFHFSTQNKPRLREQWEQPVVHVRMVGFTFGFDRPDHAWAAMTFMNDNDYPVAHLRVHCDLQDASGKKVDDTTAHFIPAKTQYTFERATLSVSKPEIQNARCNLFAAERHS